LDRLDKDALREITEWIHGSVFERCKKSPRPHQQEAIDKILQEFSRANRTTAVMACGTGKTLVGLWVMEALKPAKAIILMPSLALIRQTLHEWLRETAIQNFSFLCVCSDQTVSEGIDHLVIHQADLDFEVTTDTKRIREYLDLPLNGTKVVFTTYHSAPVVGEALKKGEGFDYGVFDEAHKTTGKKDRRTGFAVSDENILIKKRLFLTATPRRFNPYKKDENGEPEQIFSMDDKTLYGNTCFALSFGKAVDDEIICPYEVLISVITTEMVTNAMLKHGEVNIKGDSVTALQVAHQIAVRDAVNKYQLKKIFTFHQSVKAASDFTGDGAKGLKAHLPECATFHVNGEMASSLREKIMKEFSGSRLGLISNARCLTEGVDVPAVDMVAFLSPKKSQIDVIQAAGRAMRKASGKRKGYILVPLFVEQQKGESIESAVLRADYMEVWDILQNLQEQDDVLAEVISVFGQQERVQNKVNTNARVDRRIKILAPEIALKNIEASIIAKSLEKLTSTWDAFYGELQFYFSENLHCNAEYFLGRTKEDLKVLKWLSVQRRLYKQGKLSEQKTKKLNSLGIIWEIEKHQKDFEWNEWEQQFFNLTQYKKRHGHLYPEGGELGAWVDKMIVLMESNALEKSKKDLLSCIGFRPGESCETRSSNKRALLREAEIRWLSSYQKIKEWKKLGQKERILDSDLSPHLQKWVAQQRLYKKKGILPQDKIKLLDELLFPWERQKQVDAPKGATPWEGGLQEMKIWWETYGNYLFSQMTREMRAWAKAQCQMKRMGGLTAEQVKSLDDINFPWDRFK